MRRAVARAGGERLISEPVTPRDLLGQEVVGVERVGMRPALCGDFGYEAIEILFVGSILRPRAPG